MPVLTRRRGPDRAEFAAAWREFLPKRSEPDFQAWRGRTAGGFAKTIPTSLGKFLKRRSSRDAARSFEQSKWFNRFPLDRQYLADPRRIHRSCAGGAPLIRSPSKPQPTPWTVLRPESRTFRSP